MGVEIKIPINYLKLNIEIITFIIGEKKWTVMRTIRFAADTCSTVG